MESKDKRFIEKWKVKREKGKRLYVTRYTVLQAIIVFLAIGFLSPLVDYLIEGTLTFDLLFNRPYKGLVIASLTVGLILAFYSWHNNEKKYIKLVDEELR